jgi:hypothetical protein
MSYEASDSNSGKNINIVSPKQFNHMTKKFIQNATIDYDLLTKIKTSNLDTIQRRTLDRLIKIRNITVLKNTTNIVKLTKQCPHCRKSTTELATTTYLICGYESNGYDQYGCRNDWCFQCEKKLCKNWHTDQLFNKLNRSHDTICCKHHATKHKYMYPMDYCMCSNINENVRR